MNRREFVRSAVVVGGAATFGALIWGRTAYARSRVTKDLMAQALPDLISTASDEFATIPAEAGEQIRTWFHGPCLNARVFAERVCSSSFAEQLAQLTDERSKQMLFANAFISNVFSDGEIRNQVGIAAEQLGRRLDLNWRACCLRVSDRWSMQLSNLGVEVPSDLEERLAPMIRRAIDKAIRIAMTAEQKPLSEAVKSIGTTAITMLPVIRVAPLVFVPVFLFRALGYAWPAISNLLTKSERTTELQIAVSSEIAVLARRIAAEFAADAKARIEKLHQWREQALQSFAASIASMSVGYFD